MLLITTEKRKRFCQEHQILVLQPNNDIAKSMHKERNILVPQTAE